MTLVAATDLADWWKALRQETTMDENTMRMRALEMAVIPGEGTAETVARAGQYLDFLSGKHSLASTRSRAPAKRLRLTPKRGPSAPRKRR